MQVFSTRSQMKYVTLVLVNRQIYQIRNLMSTIIQPPMPQQAPQFHKPMIRRGRSTTFHMRIMKTRNHPCKIYLLTSWQLNAGRINNSG